MTQPPSASPAKDTAKTPATEDATAAKIHFVTAAHAASPLRAVEKYPWTAVTATAAATMAVTVVFSLPIVHKAGGKAGGSIFATGLGLASHFLKAKLSQTAGQPAPPPGPPPTV